MESAPGLAAARIPISNQYVPTPMAGGILIMARERVHEVDVPITAMMKCISKWGTGSHTLIQQLSPDIPPKAS